MTTDSIPVEIIDSTCQNETSITVDDLPLDADCPTVLIELDAETNVPIDELIVEPANEPEMVDSDEVKLSGSPSNDAAEDEISADARDHQQAPTASSIASNPFDEIGLHPNIVTAIAQSGYTKPTPIQAKTIPVVLAGRDLIGRAETGSGKTAAFACPLLSRIDTNNKLPQILVLAPTRELAIQVTDSFQKYGAGLPGFRAVTIYGGQSYDIQLKALRRGVQVVVGTPGRIMDHLNQGTLDLSALKTIVLDEGDEMLRMGFIDDVEWILSQIPLPRQTLLFSATMPAPIERIAQKYLTDPVNVTIQSHSATADSIVQQSIVVQPKLKLNLLAQILDSEETDAVIVFTKTRDTTVNLADQLSQRGFSVAALNGDIPQNQRERTIDQLKSGRLKVLIATDVAARGLDVQRISHVINYDFPHDTEAYIHRIGRTGRAGKEGIAILFVEPKEQGKLNRLQRETNQPIDEYRPKSLKQVNSLRIQRFQDRVTEELKVGSEKLEPFRKIVSEIQQQSEISWEDLAAVLASLAQGDSPLLLTELVDHRSNFKKDSEKGGRRFKGDSRTYRIEVGRQHGVNPGHIVGAITNETEVSYAAIGRIKLQDFYSLIDLPADLTKETIDDISDLTVVGRKLKLSPDQGRPSRSKDFSGGDQRRKGKRKDFGSSSSFRSERPSGSERSSGSDRPSRSERPAGSDRPSRSERPTRSDRSEKPGKKTKPYRPSGSYSEKTTKSPEKSPNGSTSKPAKKYIKIRG